MECKIRWAGQPYVIRLVNYTAESHRFRRRRPTETFPEVVTERFLRVQPVRGGFMTFNYFVFVCQC